MRPRAPRNNALQGVMILEALADLEAEHGPGVPFKALETAARGRIGFKALIDALNGLVQQGAVNRISEKPARLKLTETGRRQLAEYRS